MVRRKRLREFHIPKFLGIKAKEWRRLKARGETPKPDGHTFTDRKVATGRGLIPDYFWYEETLREWWPGVPTTSDAREVDGGPDHE